MYTIKSHRPILSHCDFKDQIIIPPEIHTCSSNAFQIQNTKEETTITGKKKQDGKQKDERATKIKVNISNRYGYSTA